MVKDIKLSRGYRNKNPGNIDYNPANKWQGQLGMEQGVLSPRFARFASHEYGIRALTALLVNYQDKHGIRTIKDIINRWAPSSENNTDAYVEAVARKVGVASNSTLNLHEYKTMRPLVEAIIEHELGGNPYEGTTCIDDGMRLAGIFEVANTVSKAAATKTGTTALGVSGIASMAAVAQPLITGMAGLSPWVGVALIVAVTIAAAAYFIVNRMEKA